MVPLLNPSLEPNTNRWRPGAVAPSREVPSKKANFFAPKKAFFGPKRPQNPCKTTIRRGMVATLQVQLYCHMTMSPFLPSDSKIFPEKRPQNGKKMPRMCRVCVRDPQNQQKAVYRATCLKCEFQGRLVHPQPPFFCGFQSSESPNEMPRPLYRWSLVGVRGQPRPRTVGANGGSTRVPGLKKISFSQVIPRPLGVPKQVFLAHFEFMVEHFGRYEIPKCLENGPFWDQKWVKNESKTAFSTNYARQFWDAQTTKLCPF